MHQDKHVKLKQQQTVLNLSILLSDHSDNLWRDSNPNCADPVFEMLNVMLEASKCSNLAKNEDRFVAGEIVWALEVRKRLSKKSRLIKPSDFSLTNDDFKLSKEEIRGTIGIFSRIEKARTVVYLPVYNGVSIKANEVSGKPEQLFKYVDSDYLNNTILTAIKTSVEDLLSDFDYKIYFSGLQIQQKLIQSNRHNLERPFLKQSLLLTEPSFLNISTKTSFRHDFLINNAELLKWFLSNESFLDVSEIMSQKIYSRRHEILTKSKSINTSFLKGEIVTLSNPVFLFEDGWTDSELCKIAEENIFRPFNIKTPIKHKLRSQDFFVKNYVDYVIIPEGIISFLSRKFSLSRKESESQYLVPVIDRDDVLGFDQELDEILSSPKTPFKAKKTTQKYQNFPCASLPDLDSSTQSSDYISDSESLLKSVEKEKDLKTLDCSQEDLKLRTPKKGSLAEPGNNCSRHFQSKNNKPPYTKTKRNFKKS